MSALHFTAEMLIQSFLQTPPTSELVVCTANLSAPQEIFQEAVLKALNTSISQMAYITMLMIIKYIYSQDLSKK